MVPQSFQQCCFCFYERYYYRHVPYTGITVYSMSFLLNLMLTSQLKKCTRRISERGFISYSVKYRVTKYKVWFSIHIRVVWLVVDYTAIQNSNLFTKGWGNGDFFFQLVFSQSLVCYLFINTQRIPVKTLWLKSAFFKLLLVGNSFKPVSINILPRRCYFHALNLKHTYAVLSVTEMTLLVL